MNEIKLDLNGVESEGEFQDRLYEAFDFPYYYGRNPDAFWDCITEIFDNTTVFISGIESLPEGMVNLVDQYVNMLRAYENERSGRFVVLVQK
jgi:ribonuclease inhibitor